MAERIKLPNFVGGISLQAPTFKEAYRPDDQVNYLPHPVIGLMDRMPSQFVAKLADLSGPTTKWHLVSNREAERYLMAIRADGIQVWDLDGNEFPVIASGGYDYLQTRTPGNILAFPEDFANAAWVSAGTGTVGAAGAGTGPYGATSLNSITGVSNNSSITLTQTLASATYELGTTYNWSVFVQAPTAPTGFGHSARLVFRDAGAATAEYYFIYLNGSWALSTVAGTVSYVKSGKVTNLGDRWARIDMAASPSGVFIGDAVKVELFLGTGPSGGTTWQVWGGRLELDTPVLEDGYPVAQPYLSTPTDSFRAISIRDFTYVVNKNTPVQMDSATTAAKPDPPVFYLWIRQGVPDTTYSLNGVTGGSGGGAVAAEVKTWGGDGTGLAAGELQSYRTDDIAEDFKTKLDPDPGIATCVRKGALLKVPLSSGNTITSIAATDSNGDQAMVLIYETVRDISELPYRFFNGVKIKVAEDTDLDTPGYFVEFVARDPDSDGFGDGDWVEAADFSLTTTIDQDTMPHGLARKQDDASGTATTIPYKVYFEFAPIDWSTRDVGDTESNPIPSFVSPDTDSPRKIAQIAFVQNRLVLLSGEYVIFSENGVFENFWRTTVRDVPKGDPIDISLSHPKVEEYTAVVQADGRIFVRSADVMAEIVGEPFLTPEEVRSQINMEIDSDPRVNPVSIGSRIVLVSKSGRFSKAKELLPSGNDRSYDTTDLTAEARDLVPFAVDEIQVSEQNNMLTLLPIAPDSETAQPILYCNSFFWIGRERLQNAWWKMQFGPSDTVRFAGFDENVLYVVLEREGQSILERIVFDPDLQITDQYLPVADGLLHSSDPQFEWSFSTDTDITLPFDAGDEEYIFIHDGTGAEARGTVVEADSVTADTVTFNGVDLTSDSGWIARKMERRFLFPELRPKEDSNRSGRFATAYETIQLYQLLLDYRNTGQLAAKVTIPSNLNSPYAYSVDSEDLVNGQLTIPVRAWGNEPTVELYTDGSTVRPSVVTSGEWYASIRRRGRGSRA